MKFIKNLKKIFTENLHFNFSYASFLFFIFIALMLILRYPRISSSGISAGIDICLDTLVPSLFPFMVFSALLMNSGILDFLSRKVSFFTRFFFDLPGESLPIIIISLIGGYPVGAYLINNAYEKGLITSSEGRRMLFFCVNPGMAFTFSVIGISLYSSEKIGYVVFFSSVISSLIIGFFSRFYEYGESLKKCIFEKQITPTISEKVLDTVNSCTRSIINICVWVIIFSGIVSLIDVFGFEKNTSDFFKMIFEVTNGIIIAKKDYSIMILSAVVGFGGLCIHLQIMPVLVTLKLKYKHFLCARILSGAFNCIFSFFLLKAIPVQASFSALDSKYAETKISSSVPLCVLLMIMCGLFVLGDSYTLWKKEKNMPSKTANSLQLY